LLKDAPAFSPTLLVTIMGEVIHSTPMRADTIIVVMM
jgi:hypothetical protein